MTSGNEDRPRQLGRGRRRAWVGLAVGAAVVAGLAALWHRRAPPGARTPSRRAAAVLGFKNLSGREDAAWLTKALAEMLTMELAAGERLRMIPGENVARLRVEMALPEADRLAPDTLARIRTNLGTDLVVLGSYSLAATDSGGKLQLDLRVQDAATGETAAVVSDSGTEADFLDLVSRVASQLRQKLGVEEAANARAGALRASLPSTPEVARLYSEGLAKLRLFDALAARDLLEGAVAADPKYALAHSALADAWLTLGYDDKAREEARKAFDLSAGLARQERLSVEGRYWEMAKQWEKAVGVYRTLLGVFPDSLDHGLRLAAVQATAGKGKDALATIEALRRLPPPASEDPRIDLAEAEAADSLSDYRRAQAAAIRAAEKGTRQGAQILVAQARVPQCWASWHLGQLREAIVACGEAKRIFAAAGDRHGVSLALNRTAVVLFEQGHLTEARENFEESLAVARDIGSRAQLSRGLNNLGLVLLEAGDIGRARSLFEEAAGLYRERGDKQGLTIADQNIAEALFRQGDLSRGIKLYEEALSRSVDTGQGRITGYALAGLGEALALQGDLPGARQKEEESLRICRQIGHPSYSARALFRLGEILLAQGDLPGAQKSHEEALALREKLTERGRAMQSRLALAALSLEQGRPAAAEATAREAAQEFGTEKRPDDEAWARAVLARSLIEQGKAKEAKEAIERALALSGRSQNPLLRLAVVIAAARLRVAQGEADLAARRLKDGLLEATKYGYLGLQLEARLALAEIEARSGNPAAGRTRLLALGQEASAKGFGLIARKAKDVAERSPHRSAVD